MGIGTAFLLGTANAIEARKVESSSQVKEVADRMRHSTYDSRVKEYVPSPQQIEQARRWYTERGLPFDSAPEDAQKTSKEGTSQAVDKPSSLRRDQGFPVKKGIKTARLSSETLSHKKTSEREIPQSAKETHQGEQDKGTKHPMSYGEQIATLRAAIEELQTNSNPNLELIGQARKLLTEVKGKESSEPEQESSKQARRKLQSSCFQWGIPNEVTAVGISDGDGTAIQVTYNLNTINTCADTISNVEFVATETITCPDSCTESVITRGPIDISGLPSSIAQGQTSTGTRYDTIACIQADTQTPTVPTSMSTVVYPTGTQGDSSFLQGMPKGFNVYPS